MACNGHNHRKDCNCAFSGGNHGVRVRWRGWSSRAAKTYAAKPSAVCRKCGKPVYFMAFPGGGCAFYDSFGPPWPKHPCTDQRLHYSPFNAKGLPKLRNRRSKFEKDGWLPLFIRKLTNFVRGTLVSGAALDSKTVRTMGFDGNLEPELTVPIFFRLLDKAEPNIELNFFPVGALEAISVYGFDNCYSEIELLSKLNARR